MKIGIETACAYRKVLSILYLFLTFSPAALKSQSNIGIFENNEDIGHPKIKGSASFDPSGQVYDISGGGYNIWFNRDEFHFLYKKIKGDFILTADFEFTGDTVGAAGHRKIGWMIRQSTEEDAASFNSCIHLDGLVVLQWRPYKGMYMRDPDEEFFYPKKGGQTIQLERIGRSITMKVAHRGEPLQIVGSVETDVLDSVVLAGVYILSHDSNALAHAKIWNVRIDKPVFQPYISNPHAIIKSSKDIFASRLEILDIKDGSRKIIYEANARFEAPNWMPDGKNLLFNQAGHLYQIPLEGGTPKSIYTGSVNENNNDHAISFDGRMLAISSQRTGMPGGGSTIYTLPLNGGKPRMITENTPSYLHGWNPNGKELVFVGRRNGSMIYNLYKVSLKNLKEIPLTSNETGHVDGPEYSPDGKYIYYNANITGTMQIWRMLTDGTGKEQLTFDEYHNWFPHISPDGKWMVFISFSYDIDPNAHPFYKQVMLRLMPLTVPGSPRVLAYLFGGQGTLNAPCWSPDSRHIAFVSNSESIR